MDCVFHMNNINNCIIQIQLKAEAQSSLSVLDDMISVESSSLNIENMLTTIMEKENGIIKFICKKKSDKDYIDIVVQALLFIKNIIITHKKEINPYITEILIECRSCISKWVKTSLLHCAAYDVLLAIAQNTPWDNLNEADILELLSELLSNTERITFGHRAHRKNLTLIGCLMENYPEYTSEQSSRILRILLSKLEHQVNNINNSAPEVLEGCLESIYSFLRHFSEEFDKTDQFYGSIKILLLHNTHRKMAQRAALNIIKKYGKLFREQIYKDCVWWFFMLSDWLTHSNKEDRKVTYEVFDSFYEQICQMLLVRKTPEDKSILKNLINSLTNIIENDEEDADKLRLAIKNLGRLAEACNVHSILDEVTDTFKCMLQKIEQNYIISGNEKDTVNLCDYVYSMAEVLRTIGGNVIENDLQSIERITLILMESYPQLQTQDRWYLTKCIARTFFSVSQMGYSVFEMYLDKVVYLGLVKSCAHVIQSDVEILKEVLSDEDVVISYISYVPMWKDICSLRGIDAHHDQPGVMMALQRNVRIKVHDKFIDCTLRLMGQLDLTVITTNVKMGDNVIEVMKPKVQSDFILFYNLVDLFHDVITSTESHYLHKWIANLIDVFTEGAIKYNGKCGYYKLVSALFNIANKMKYFDNLDNDDWVIRRINEFTKMVMPNVKYHKGAEMITCVEMLLNSPIVCLKSFSSESVPLFKIVFTVGLNNIPLARKGVKTLKNWKSVENTNDLNSLLREILPLLQSFLQSKRFAGDTETMTESEKRLLNPIYSTRKKYTKLKRDLVATSNTDLQKVRKEIASFLGELDSETCSFLVTDDFPNISQQTRILPFDIPFVDMKINIHMDALLPRVMELALSSGDYKTRIVACELLHSIVILFLGKCYHLEVSKVKPMTILCDTIFRVVLKLASDENLLIKQLFHPLAMQIIHYYSSTLTHESQSTAILIQIIFDDMTNEDDTQLRDLAAECLKEFIIWSIKHMNPSDLHRSPVNIKAVIKRIYIYSLHSCQFKRLGAAMAYNNIYHVIREEKSLVDEYWLELMYHFVESLSMCKNANDCDVIEIQIAIKHIERVVKELSHVFNKENPSRRKPEVFKGCLLSDVNDWLLSKCLSLNCFFRKTVTQLITNIAPFLPEFQSVQEYFEVLIATRGYSGIIKLFENDILRNFTNFKNVNWNEEKVKELLDWLKWLLASLETYIWLFKNSSITCDIFSNTNSEFLKSLNYFMDDISGKDFQEIVSPNKRFVLNVKDEFMFTKLKSELVVQCFKLIAFCETSFGPNIVDNFIKLLFKPECFSLEPEMKEEIPNITKTILKSIHENRVKMNDFAEMIKNELNKKWKLFLENLRSIVNKEKPVSISDRNFLFGLIEIGKTLENEEERIYEVVNVIYESIAKNGIAVVIQVMNMTYLRKVLRFAVSRILGINRLYKMLENDELIKYADSEVAVTHGHHFFTTFKDVILDKFISNLEHFIDIIFSKELNENVNYILIQCLNYLRYSSKKPNASRKANIMVKKIFSCWTKLREFNEFSTKAERSLISVIISSAQTKENPFGSLIFQEALDSLKWLISRFFQNRDASKEIRYDALDALPYFSSYKSKSEFDEEVEKGLSALQRQFESNDKRSGIEQKELSVTIGKLLNALNASGSLVILKSLILWPAVDYAFKDDLQIILQKFIKRIPVEYQYDTLKMTYDAFVCENANSSLITRSIDLYLIPLIYSCDVIAMRKFYVTVITPCLEILRKQITTPEKDISLKIGALKMVETLFQNIDKSEFENKSSEINKSLPVNDAILGAPQVFIREAMRLLRSSPPFDESKELARILRCCAYNTLIYIVMKTKNDIKFYDQILFKETPLRNEYIWRKIVNTDNEISLGMVFSELPSKRKKLRRIRNEVEGQNTQQSEINTISLIPSDYLSSSSISEEISKFDMSGYHVRSDEQAYFNQQENNDTVILEDDLLNKHECMENICNLITHMVHNQISPIPKPQEDIVFPKWMEYLRTALINKMENRNVKLLILKIIHNCEEFFKPFAKYWLSAIMESILSLNCNINYFITDIIVMIMMWHQVCIPSAVEKSITSSIFNFVIQINNPYERVDILKYRVELVAFMVKVWKDCLNIPYAKLQDMIASKALKFPLEIANVLLTNEIKPYEECYKLTFVRAILSNVSYDGRTKTVYCFQILGLILRMESRNGVELTQENNEIFKLVVNELRIVKESNLIKRRFDLFLDCLRHACDHYPILLKPFLIFILNNFGRLQGIAKTRCLKMFCNDFEILPIDLIPSLIASDFVLCLRINDQEMQITSLNLIKNLMDKIEDKFVVQLFEEVCCLSKNMNSECRALSYDIMHHCYIRYRHSQSENLKVIADRSKEVLLNGLLDNDYELQVKITRLWSTTLELESDLNSTYLKILSHMYCPSVENWFLSYFCEFLLNATKATPDFETLIFQHSLADCKFEDYKIMVLWRNEHKSIAPMFVNSLCSQLATTTSFNELNTIQIRATQRTLNFQPTIALQQQDKAMIDQGLYSEPSFLYTNSQQQLQQDDHVFKKPISPPLKQDIGFNAPSKLRRRFLEDKGKISRIIANRNIIKNESRKTLIEEKSSKNERKVNIYRKYRKGDFPDIQITYSAVITPLQAIAKRDSAIANEILKCVFRGLFEKLSEQNNLEYKLAVNEKLQEMLSKSIMHDTSFIRMIYQCFFQYNQSIEFDFDTKIITSVSQSSGLLSFGCLLLEDAICRQQLSSSSNIMQSSKKFKNDDPSDDAWIKLAELYQSLGEEDVLNGILKEKYGNWKIQDALYLQQCGKLGKAHSLYLNMIEENLQPDSSHHDFLYDLYYQCCAEIPDWNKMGKTIRKRFNSNLNSIWDNNRSIRYDLPWLLKCETQTILHTQHDANNFLPILDTWLADTDKSSMLHTYNNVGEQLSMLLLAQGKIPQSRLMIEQSIEQCLDKWASINTYDKLHHQKLTNLQTLAEIDTTLTLLCADVHNIIHGKDEALLLWDKKRPKFQDSLIVSDNRLLYRRHFTKMLSDKLENEGLLTNDIKMSFMENDIQSYYSIIDCAIAKRNFWAARKHVSWCYEWYYGKISDERKTMWHIYQSKVKLLMASTFEDDLDKFKCVMNSWKMLDVCLKYNLSGFLHEYHKQAYNISSELFDIYSENRQIDDLLPKSIKDEISARLISYNQTKNECSALNALELFAIHNLKLSITAAFESNSIKELQLAYLSLVNFLMKRCDEESDCNKLDYSKDIVMSMLRAMKYGSKDAIKLFATLFQLQNIHTEEVAIIFRKESEEVEEWKFIGWIDQLMANLDTKLVSVVGPLVIRLSKVYPNAVQLPFLLSKLMYKYEHQDTNNIVKNLEQIFENNSPLSNVIKGLSFVTVPQNLLKYHINAVINASTHPDLRVLLEELKEIPFINNEQDNLNKGVLYQKLDKYRNTVNEAVDSYNNRSHSKEELITSLNDILSRIRKDEQTTNTQDARKCFLKSYNPFLAQFKGHKNVVEIEIPGQYTGFCKPLPEYHTKIFAFKDTVEVMKSLNKPIKITIMGNDAKEYIYLVKFNEDLRQDRRIQQLFTLMNQSFKSHDSRNKFSINTYKVVPLTMNTGLIEWVNNTMPLNEFLSHQNDKEQFTSMINQLQRKYISFIESVRTEGQKKWLHYECYCEVAKTFNSSTIIANFKNIVASVVPRNIIRASLMSLSGCEEMYMILRNEFIRSYATLCISHWLLGIGDRHLGNMLVSLSNASCIGIDFGQAFGAGIQCSPVPELIPFRLTPHIVQLMQPLGVTGFIRETMVNCLKILSDNRRVLLSTMQVFIQEPSLDWLKHAKQTLKLHSIRNNDTLVSAWYPQHKITMAKLKLEGSNPIVIFTEELKLAYHLKEAYRSAFIDLVKGNCERNKRATHPLNGLTPAQQVDCLLDLATDEHILGITWCGLQTWI